MKIFRLLSLLLVVLLASCLNKKKSADTGIPGNESRYVVLAYSYQLCFWACGG